MHALDDIPPHARDAFALIRAIMRAFTGDDSWPSGRGRMAIEPEVWPRFRFEHAPEVTYALDPESPEATVRVVEASPSRIRRITAEGVVEEIRVVDPSAN